MLTSFRKRVPDTISGRHLAIYAIFGYAAFLFLIRTYKFVSDGGGSYQTSDWLINYSGGPVRRGISGEILLALANWTQVNPVTLVSLLVTLLTALVVAAIAWHLSALKLNDRLLLAVLSPAFVLFWANDFGATHRKELLGIAAFTPLLAILTTSVAAEFRRFLVVCLYGIAVAFHEVNVFLGPLLCAAVVVRFPEERTKNAWTIFVIACLALAGAFFARYYDTVESLDPICLRILGYGLSPDLCGGVFTWLEDGPERGVRAVAQQLSETSIVFAVLLIAICMLPVLAMVSILRFSRFEVIAMFLGVLALLPVFLLAIDWGRWVALATFGLTFIALIRASAPGSYLGSPALPKSLFGSAIAVQLGVGIESVRLVPVEGFVYAVAKSIAYNAP